MKSLRRETSHPDYEKVSKIGSPMAVRDQARVRTHEGVVAHVAETPAVIEKEGTHRGRLRMQVHGCSAEVTRPFTN